MLTPNQRPLEVRSLPQRPSRRALNGGQAAGRNNVDASGRIMVSRRPCPQPYGDE